MIALATTAIGWLILVLSLLGWVIYYFANRKQARPELSVISVGERNRFHHPSPQTLAILSSVPGNKIFRTDRDGAVEIISDGYVLSVSPLVRS